MNVRDRLLVLLVVVLCPSAWAADYYCDPAAEAGGDGSQARPWPLLADAIMAGHVGKLKAGDTLYLLDGYHGTVQSTGRNKAMVTLAAAPNARPQLGRLAFDRAANWTVKGLRISPTFDGKGYRGSIVDIGGNCTGITLEGCEVFAVDDHAELDARAWMKLNNGIGTGRGENVIIRDCYVRNIRFGVSLVGKSDLIEGCVIENFSGDGLRMINHEQTARHNIIRDCFVSSSEGDRNHDDAIQCWYVDRGKEGPELRNVKINHNIIIGQRTDKKTHAAQNQAIGLFDGPLVGFHIEGNVVMTDHWHGISVYDAQECEIINNVVWTEFADVSKARPTIWLGSKKGLAKDNTVKGNYSVRYDLNQPGTKAADNQAATKAIYEKALVELGRKIVREYGRVHESAQRDRLTGKPVE